jgi:hypothetical protein
MTAIIMIRKSRIALAVVLRKAIFILLQLPPLVPLWLPVLPPRIYTFRFAIILEKK